RLGHRDEALSVLRRALEIYEALVRADPKDVTSQDGLAYSLLYLGQLHREAGREAEALPFLRRAGEITRKLAEEETLNLFELACMQALSASLTGGGNAELTGEERSMRKRYADRAVESLRRAIAAGVPTAPPTA